MPPTAAKALDDRVTVRLPPAHLEALDAEVATGGYKTRSELLRELVRRWAELRDLSAR